ncbi:cobalt transport protein CbiM [Actinobacillus equuli]|nr:cobalt transport protein CbiM [Actinobacillus equuli]
MHLSEGVLHAPTLLVGAVIATVGVAIGLRKLDYGRLTLTALFASAFLLPEPFMYLSALVVYI